MTRSDMKIRLGLPTSFAVLAALMLVPSNAEAQDVLFACYAPSGVVYRVNPPTAPGQDPKLKDGCTGRPHVLFNWNEEGPAGADGAEGPQGPQGPPGPAGSPGVLWASVDALGRIVGGSTGVTSQEVFPGNVAVTFPRSISGCAHVATSRANFGFISTFQRSNGPVLEVAFRDTNRLQARSGFGVIVAC